MFRNSYQRGMLTIFYSAGSNPFKIWEAYTKNGYVTRLLDEDIRSMVCDIRGTNVSTTYLTCPKGQAVLGISMPFLIMIVKNLNKYFSFEVTILDETKTRRRFRVSNFQSTTQILPLCTVMPIGLSDGWNQIQFNLSEFTRRAYKKQFVEVQKLKINANIRLRRVYFTERLIPENELPAEYKLYFPITGKRKSPKRYDKIKEEPIADQPLTEERKPSSETIKVPSVHSSAHSVKKATSVMSQRIETVPESDEPVVENDQRPPSSHEELEDVADEEFKGEQTPAEMDGELDKEQADGEGRGAEDAPLLEEQVAEVSVINLPETEEKGVQVDTINVPVNEGQVESAVVINERTTEDQGIQVDITNEAAPEDYVTPEGATVEPLTEEELAPVKSQA